MTTLTESAFAAIPGYAAASKAVANTRTWAAELSAINDPREVATQVIGDLVTAARTAKAMPAEPINRYLTAVAANRDAHAIRSIGESACQHAQHQLDLTIGAGIDHAYAYLADQLAQLVAEVVESADILRAQQDPAAAIRQGRTAKWETAAALVDRYAELRSAHLQVMKAEDPDLPPSKLAVAGQLADHLDVDPHWLGRRKVAGNQAHNAGVSARKGSARADHLAWLGAGQDDPDAGRTRTRLAPNGMTDAQWLLVVAGRQPWVPTASQTRQAYRLAQAATESPMSAESINDRIMSRIHHAEITGQTPPTLDVRAKSYAVI